MKEIYKFIFSNLIVPLLRIAARGAGFDQNYLKGRYFDHSLQGWRWVLRALLVQKILGFNRHVPWPISPSNSIDDPSGVTFDPDDLQNFMHHGCYLSNVNGGKINIGKGTVIAPNIGIITTNHKLDDISKHMPAKNVIIGKNCWLGMNSVLLPGVCLGDNTVVAAGAVVSSSHPEGWCVLAGTPAKVLKLIQRPADPLVEHPSVCPDDAGNQ